MEALETLYRNAHAGFSEAIAPIVGSRELADDVVQEAFAVALRKRRSLRRQSSAGAWVWQIAYRLALRERKRQGKSVEVMDDLTIWDAHRDPELASAIRTLAPRRRLVVFLHYFADMSYPEIADALSISEGTVAATLSQARDALHTELTLKEVAG